MNIHNINLLLASGDVPLIIGIVVLAISVAAFIVAFLYIKKNLKKAKELEEKANAHYTQTVEKCDNLRDKTAEECNALKKEAILEAKEQEINLRKELERETKEKKEDLKRYEQRLNQKDEILNKKDANLLRRTEELEDEAKELEKKNAGVDKLLEDLEIQKADAASKLEEIAKLSHEEARKIVISEIEDDAKKEALQFVKNEEEKAKDEAEKKAREIISLAIQRCAVDVTSESTVTTVTIPSDDMKARLIGREGRNITALENATGIKLIIDDTPEVVVASGFDPVRREVARRSLEKLVQDGRIQPARIEETVNKVKKDLENIIKEAGETATFEVGVYGVHPELVKALGRLKFRTSYGQNVLQHSLEVAHIAGLLAQELGVDVNLARRGGLLHDIGKSVDFENEGTHITLGVELAKKFKENRFVINCIESHHGEVPPMTIEAVLVQAADAISGCRPGARREIESNYMKRLEALEDIANAFPGVEKTYAIQAGREIRVMVKPEQIDDAKATFLARDIAKKIEESLEYPGQIKVNVIREFRSIEYAK